MPEVKESGYGIVPTSSTAVQLALGDAISIALMKIKKFGKLEFKKFHPAGNLSKKLKTASEIMLTKNKIPFVHEKLKMKQALKILNSKKLGFLVVTNDKSLITGIFTDGDLKRLMQKKKAINNLEIKKFVTKNPYTVEENTLATDILTHMNKRKITNVCVYKKRNKKKITGVIHIHNLLSLLKNWLMKKQIVQLILLSIIFLLLGIFYMNYMKNDKFKETNISTESYKTLDNVEKNLIENLKYEVNLGNGIKYFISSNYSEIINQDNDELINMISVISKIFENDSILLEINSDTAIYNNRNYDSIFKNNVKISYFNNFIFADQMKLNFKDSLIEISGNVIYEGPLGSIKTDNIEINILTKKINIFMKNKKNNVKVISN